MAARDTQAALRRVKAFAKANDLPTDLDQWSAVDVRQDDSGTWSMTVHTTDGEEHDVEFTEGELMLSELYAAKGFNKTHPKGTDFSSVIISIDSPGASEPGAFANLTRQQVRDKVRASVDKLGLPGEPTPPEPSLWDRVKKVGRMLRLRLRL